MSYIATGEFDERVEGKLYSFRHEDQSYILIFKASKPNVYSAICPHQGANLCDGAIDAEHIICPLHKRKFEVETGKDNTFGSQLVKFPSRLDGNTLYVDFSKSISNEAILEEKKIRTIGDLPQPKGSWLLGNLNDFKAEDKHNVLERWANELGDIYKIRLATQEFIVSADESLNQQILKKRPKVFRRFHKIDEVMSEMGVNGVFNTEGEEWYTHRKLIAEALNLKNVKSYIPNMVKVTERLLERWGEESNNSLEVDLQQELMRYTVDITSLIAFGHDANTLEQDGDIIQEHLEKIFPMVNDRITAPIPFWRFYKTKKDKELDIALQEIRTYVQQLIDESRDNFINGSDLNPTNFLEALLLEQSKAKGFSDHDVFGNVFTMLLAGEDTTSNSISWTLFYVLQNSEVLEKIQSEVRGVLTNKKLPTSLDELNQLVYTEAVIQEALRIKPVTPSLYMQALEDVTIDGLFIEKGMTVMMQNKVPHTKESNFTAADSFIPERWLEGGCPHHKAHKTDVIKTFGGGPRFCPGKNLAIMEMKIAIAAICHNFNLSLAVSPDKVKERFAFTMFPENLKVTIAKRENSKSTTLKESMV
ncbi:cytochrome P450 [Sediminitomix flava]|uniref:Cytochrome P450 n=1 Tax=Sediminitomix flava TaxID=379075 RepID=A0A315ZAU7_SEDFL|nr:cytochrome P450 [Sediminitomix flava]PWJ42716.1 cytochrome P450 [Sediminitomix flava]